MIELNYCQQYNGNAYSTAGAAASGIMTQLNANRPSILAGYLYNPQNNGGVNHNVVVYGTYGAYFVAHYGWHNYPLVVVSTQIAGSNASFVPN